MKRAVCILIITAIIGTASFYAFAYDEATVSNYEIWLDGTVSTQEIEDTRLEGIFQYFIDGKTLYCHISHNAQCTDDDIVFIGININEHTGFEFNENGLKNNSVHTMLQFENNKSELYFAVDFKDKELLKDKNSIKITLLIDNTAYLISSGTEAVFSADEKTTSKRAATTKPKETAAKSKTSTEKSTKEKSIKEAATKLKYSGTAGSERHNESEAAESATASSGAAESIITEQEDSTSSNTFSPTSKALLLLSGAFISAGFILLLSAAYKKYKLTMHKPPDTKE